MYARPWRTNRDVPHVRAYILRRVSAISICCSLLAARRTLEALLSVCARHSCTLLCRFDSVPCDEPHRRLTGRPCLRQEATQ